MRIRIYNTRDENSIFGSSDPEALLNVDKLASYGEFERKLKEALLAQWPGAEIEFIPNLQCIMCDVAGEGPDVMEVEDTIYDVWAKFDWVVTTE